VTRAGFLPSLDAMLAELTQCVTTRELTGAEIAQAMTALLDAAADNAAKAAFLRAWAQRGETANELAACAKALLPRAADPGVRGSWNGKPLLDCCGTGGGGLNLLNISTGIVFILAAMGIPVVKHGNRGLTKKSGSADVLEALGIRIDLPPEKLGACLEEVGAAFLFAPAYHTSFAVLAPVRSQLGAEGQRTVFNLLGPLLNPAQPDARLVGVFTEKNLHLYHATLAAMGCPHFEIACGEDALAGKKIGEVSANGTTLITGTRARPTGEASFVWTSRGDSSSNLETMLVPDAATSAARLTALLSNREAGYAKDTLLLNAAVAAWTQGAVPTIEEGVARAQEVLDSGRALAVLQKWQEFSKLGGGNLKRTTIVVAPSTYQPSVGIRLFIWGGIYLLGPLIFLTSFAGASSGASFGGRGPGSPPPNYLVGLLILILTFPLGLTPLGYVVYFVHFVLSLCVRWRFAFYILIFLLVLIVTFNVNSCATQHSFSP
jgi:anthranilate phosphoribosyltransferase